MDIVSVIKSQLIVFTFYVIDRLERDFQISKHHLISQREKKIIGYTIVSGKNLKILDMLYQVQIDRGQPEYFISTEVDSNTHW